MSCFRNYFVKRSENKRPSPRYPRPISRAVSENDRLPPTPYTDLSSYMPQQQDRWDCAPRQHPRTRCDGGFLISIECRYPRWTRRTGNYREKNPDD